VSWNLPVPTITLALPPNCRFCAAMLPVAKLRKASTMAFTRRLHHAMMYQCIVIMHRRGAAPMDWAGFQAGMAAYGRHRAMHATACSISCMGLWLKKPPEVQLKHLHENVVLEGQQQD
jgi:hypothetical protein